MNDKMVYSETLEQRDCFLDGSNQFQVRIIRIKHHPSMRMKGKNNRFAKRVYSYLLQRRNYLLMPQMNTIKSADSHDPIVNLFKLLQRMINRSEERRIGKEC